MHQLQKLFRFHCKGDRAWQRGSLIRVGAPVGHILKSRLSAADKVHSVSKEVWERSRTYLVTRETCTQIQGWAFLALAASAMKVLSHPSISSKDSSIMKTILWKHFFPYKKCGFLQSYFSFPNLISGLIKEQIGWRTTRETTWTTSISKTDPKII